MRTIGLHIRLTDSIDGVASRAQTLEIPIFQTFAFYTAHEHAKKPTLEQINNFLIRRPQFGPLFLHASYWINCAHCAGKLSKFFELELELAQRLSFNYVVLHPGAIGAHQTKPESLRAIAAHINLALEKYQKVQILLENVAHARRALGGDIHDLAHIQKYVKYPERLGFCIDTAHAYAFGYDLVNKQEEFIELLDDQLGHKNIKLIHLTDTNKQLGSAIDAHVAPGKGQIGVSALQRFLKQPTLKNVPVIIELPLVSPEEELRVLHEVREWNS